MSFSLTHHIPPADVGAPRKEATAAAANRRRRRKDDEDNATFVAISAQDYSTRGRANDPTLEEELRGDERGFFWTLVQIKPKKKIASASGLPSLTKKFQYVV